MDEDAGSSALEHVAFTVDIVSAYVSNNSVPAAELAPLIAVVHAALAGLAAAASAGSPVADRPSPAQIRKSITHDHLLSFEDGKPYKTLRRHLTLRGLTPEAYREKWGLPNDYPMTAASYSAQRSELARALGLGQQRRTSAAPKAEADATHEAPKGRSRRKAAAAPSA